MLGYHVVTAHQSYRYVATPYSEFTIAVSLPRPKCIPMFIVCIESYCLTVLLELEG